MEKGPEFRIVGDTSAKEKEKVKKEIKQALFSHFESLSPQEREQFEKFEYPKSEKELALINFVNKESDELMREAGIEPYDIPAENYHIIPPELYKKVASGGTAKTFNIKQEIIFDAQYFRDNPVYFGTTSFHETLHTKAHFSVEKEKGGNKVNKTSYRQGVVAEASQRNRNIGSSHAHFKGLDEAIVSAQEKKLLPKLLDLPLLKEEKKWLMSDEAKGLREELAVKEKIPEDDFIWIGKKRDNDYDDYEFVSYQRPRQVLDYVCAEIQKQFPDLYENTDDVSKEFLKTNFTGQLLIIARLVEETFGEGSFRLLGNMDTDRQSAILTLETLKKARIRQTE